MPLPEQPIQLVSPAPEANVVSSHRFIRGIAGAAAGLALIATGCSSPERAPAPIVTATQESAPTTPEPTMTPEKPAIPGLIWEQDFTKGGVLDALEWTTADRAEPIYNDEAQLYDNSPENVSIEDGALVLRARYAEDGQLTSGRVDMRGSQYALEPGKRVEVTAKLPKGAGTWPAIWFLSQNEPHTTKLKPTDADWNREGFYAHNGEVDGVEGYGHKPGYVESTVWNFANYSNPQEHGSIVADASDAFHTYGVEHNGDSLVFTRDGQKTFTVTKPAGAENAETWPYTANNKLFLILNLAMGGTGGGNIDKSPEAQAGWKFAIESVRVIDLAAEAADK